MKAQFEKVLTRIPAYVLIGASMWLIILAAIVYSTLGMTTFGPFDIVVTAALFAAVCVGTSLAFGKAYGIAIHLQSSLVSALILTLILSPTTNLVVLVEYALIAIIAMASKFVIAPRGQHIFNPAAFGVFIGGLLQLQSASWWIGSPTFITLVAILAFVILYKTRQLLTGALFIAVAVVVIVGSGTLRGEAFPDLISSAFLSWPIVFMAGFMLSEPLTLPPRRIQRIALAIIVGIVVALPFHVGWFSSSPAFALIVGNLFALSVAWRQRRGLRLTLSERRGLTSNVREFVLSSATPIEFEAGQYVELTIPHAKQDIRGTRRTFSITSRPGEQQLRIASKFYNQSSTFKDALLDLPIGARVQATGINGDFVLPKNLRQKLLFIAGGIGITPFISHIRSLSGKKSDILVLYFNHSPTSIAYRDFLDASDAKVAYFVAKNPSDSTVQAETLTPELLREYIRDLSEREVYISGPPAMVANAKAVVGTHSVRVHTDYFSGY